MLLESSGGFRELVNKCPKPCGADFQVRVAWRPWKPTPHAQRFYHKLEETAPALTALARFLKHVIKADRERFWVMPYPNDSIGVNRSRHGTLAACAEALLGRATLRLIADLPEDEQVTYEQRPPDAEHGPCCLVDALEAALHPAGDSQRPALRHGPNLDEFKAVPGQERFHS